MRIACDQWATVAGMASVDRPVVARAGAQVAHALGEAREALAGVGRQRDREPLGRSRRAHVARRRALLGRQREALAEGREDGHRVRELAREALQQGREQIELELVGVVEEDELADRVGVDGVPALRRVVEELKAVGQRRATFEDLVDPRVHARDPGDHETVRLRMFGAHALRRFGTEAPHVEVTNQEIVAHTIGQHLRATPVGAPTHLVHLEETVCRLRVARRVVDVRRGRAGDVHHAEVVAPDLRRLGEPAEDVRIGGVAGAREEREREEQAKRAHGAIVEARATDAARDASHARDP